MSKDSFADLWTSKTGKSAEAKLSLAERQKQEAAKKAEQAKQWSGLDYLGGGIGGGSSTGSSGLLGGPITSTDTGSFNLSSNNTSRPTDILAAGPTGTTSSSTARARAGNLTADNTGSSNPFMPTFKIVEDPRFETKVQVPKDPFDLMDLGMQAPISNSSTGNNNTTQTNTIEEEDDPFAVFNQPVKKAPEPERKPERKAAQKPKPRSRADFEPEPAYSEPERTSTPGGDKAVAELVDMGFSAEQASAALAMTPTGKEVAMAIDIIMKQAHAAAKGETYVPPTAKKEQPRQSRQPRNEPVDEWERQSRMQESSSSRSSRSREPFGDNNEDMFADASKVASQLGAQFMSKAGSLWSVGRKNLAKAVENYQGGSRGGAASDGSPAWMKDAKNYEEDAGGFNDSYQPMGESFKDSDDSDEEEEEQHSRPPPRQQQRQAPASRQAPPPSNGKYKFNEEEETIAPRRRRPEPKKETPPPPKEAPKKEPDLVGDLWDAPVPAAPAKKAPAASSNGGASLIGSTSASTASTNRPHVAISSMAMEMISDGREKGAEAVKQGSYDIALEHYNQALANVPSPHTLRALLLSNRAFCHLKAGDAKAAIVDSEEGITIIGPTLGAGEEVEPGKSLQEIWSKLVMRKAEGLEHQEKHQQALDQWTLLVSKGFTTKPVMDGKRRCQVIVTPKTAPKPAAKSSKPAAARPAAKPASSAPTPAGKYENLDRVRASHAKTAKEEAEKAALGDIVAGKIETWRAGNEDNLRALLATLDSVLWPEVGWKKITVADLVVNKKVKINYMKAVAKTHPDKISAETSTEKKMIANGVFITLNKAWDSFKVQNNMS